MAGSISIVIGSWGSYNECNERALGSKWLDLSDYEEWDVCFVKDMVLHYIAGYSVGWFEQGAQTAPCWYENPE